MSKEKNGKKKHFGWIILLLVIILAVLAFLYFFGKGGFGGFGFGGEGNSGASNSEVSGESGNASEEHAVVVIEIKENDIFIDGESVPNENALKEKITEIGNSKKYELIHETAIEDTYRKVYNVLKELEGVLDIEVNYNE